MNHLRRNFIKTGSFATGALFLKKPFTIIQALSKHSSDLTKEINTITILHTNDLCNQIDPLRGKLDGYGGIRNIGNIIKQKTSGQLLFDAGNFLNENGSPEEHRQMIAHMNQLEYKAAAIGAKELSRGEDYLAGLLPLMKFRMVNCNYSFNNQQLQENIPDYLIVKYGAYKIGITGVGPDLTDDASQACKIRYAHPYDRLNQVALLLKEQYGCDLVICLSRLGDGLRDNHAAAIELAKSTKNVDLIISGNKDSIDPNTVIVKNNEKREVIVSPGGWGGLLVKQINFVFNNKRERRILECKNYVPGLESGLSAYQVSKSFIS